MMKSPLSYDFYGYNMNAPDAGTVAVWIWSHIRRLLDGSRPNRCLRKTSYAGAKALVELRQAR